jgi:peptidoglycan/LPS O-acetylase OafA/YrhL
MHFSESTKPRLLRSDIQQIRAISVIAVVLFHSFPDRFMYGYLGVDAFFFLSGFLIFPQIYDISKSASKKSLTLNVKNFLLRRIYRIAPALGVCILVVWMLFFFFGPSPNKLSGPEFYITILSIFGFGNIAALNYSGDYFNSSSPLTHFWSLGVEMQSYLLFAILVLFISRYINKNVRQFRIFLLIIILISLISKYIFVFHSNLFGLIGLDTLAITGNFSDFYLTSNRLWQFALGGLYATFTTNNSKQIILNKKTSILLLVTVCLFLFSNINFVNNFRTILILFGIGVYLISSFNGELKYVSKVLVWIGDRSYSIYLYHMPVLFILNADDIPSNLKYLSYSAAIVVILILSSFSYKYIEINHKIPQTNVSKSRNFFVKHKKLISTSYILPVFSITVVLILNNIFPAQNNFSVNFRDNYAASELSNCRLGQIGEPCILVGSFAKHNWLLLGDSHAGAIQGVLSKIAKQSNSDLLVWNKCRFFDPILSRELNDLFPKWCVESNTKRIEYIKKFKPSYIFIAYQNGSVANGDTQMPQELWQKVFTKTLASVNNNTSKVVLFSQIPEYKTAPFSEYRFSFPKDKSSNLDEFPSLPIQRIFEDKLRNQGIFVIDLVPVFCNSTNCTRFFNDWLYLDSNHLSNFGAELIQPTIEKFLIANQLT